MTALPIVIDCDPGIDDALALLLAMAEAPRLDIAAITTVAGNVGAVATERNARRLRDLAGRPDI
ncbi:MAG: nucleoside hydrolase, partial [Pseudomonadota bacterium]|nr:nucleoside hydrolase [Pseudomonadota bacterium]